MCWQSKRIRDWERTEGARDIPFVNTNYEKPESRLLKWAMLLVLWRSASVSWKWLRLGDLEVVGKCWQVIGFRTVSIGYGIYIFLVITFNFEIRTGFQGKNIMEQGKIFQNCHQHNEMKRPKLSRTYTQNPTYTPNYTYRIMITIPLKIHFKLSRKKRKKKTLK